MDWSNLTEDLVVYSTHSDILMSKAELPKDAAVMMWTVKSINQSIKNPQHELCSLYENIVKSLSLLSRSLCKIKMYKAKPGWDVYVEELHAEARRSFRAWVESGQQKYGPLFQHNKCTNVNFKCLLCFIRRNEFKHNGIKFPSRENGETFLWPI